MNLRAKAGIKAGALHLLASLLVATVLAYVVFGVWYPYPHRAMAGGTDLFLLVIAVDAVCGPLLTAVVFNPGKPRRELATDLSFIVLVQLGALAYGTHAVATLRPVALVFEADRMVSVAAGSIPQSELRNAPPEFASLSWTGPLLLGSRKPKDAAEQLRSIDMSLQGVEVSMRPSWWQPYAMSLPDIKARMKPLPPLYEALGESKRAILAAAVERSGHSKDQLFYLPLTSALVTDWIVLLDEAGSIVDFAEVDGFLAWSSSDPKGSEAPTK